MTSDTVKTKRWVFAGTLLLIAILMFFIGRMVAKGQLISDDIFAATYFIGFFFGIVTGMLVVALGLARPPVPPRMPDEYEGGD